ncbi:hypothetical protein O3G_MSEX010202 [Manduca sexta]|uniref:Uncharacterized protein n=1 Tax=Manduca sexta TaxID=7130 RepID=A0A921ZGC8_MANSE|nr:hypothetical protein O3G_MSEX010202 [Manduca sexta]
MMDSSPKRYASNFTSSTAQRGVEAKEVEIANARLDVNVSTSSQIGAESSQQDADDYGPLEDTGSYLQVVVEKHRRKHERAAVAVQTARLPSASSPAAGVADQGGTRGRGSCGAGDGGSVVWAGPVLVSRAALPALRATELPYTCSRCVETSWPGCKLATHPSAPEERVERKSDARPLVTGGVSNQNELRNNRTLEMFRNNVLIKRIDILY